MGSPCVESVSAVLGHHQSGQYPETLSEPGPLGAIEFASPAGFRFRPSRAAHGARLAGQFTKALRSTYWEAPQAFQP